MSKHVFFAWNSQICVKPFSQEICSLLSQKCLRKLNKMQLVIVELKKKHGKGTSTLMSSVILRQQTFVKQLKLYNAFLMYFQPVCRQQHFQWPFAMHIKRRAKCVKRWIFYTTAFVGRKPLLGSRCTFTLTYNHVSKTWSIDHLRFYQQFQSYW